VSERRYLSIGEVLGLLLEEFPDVTISKIRFLESQGLIDPERTPSGYRKFYDEDVERLRVILREQRENFLPLRVIKDRLDTGELTREIDTSPSGSIRLPRSVRRTAGGPPPLAAGARPADREPAPTGPAPGPLTLVSRGLDASAGSAPAGTGSAAGGTAVSPAPVPEVATVGHPAARRTPARETGLTADELCAKAGVDTAFLDQLEEFGIVTSGRVGGWRVYDADSIRAVIAAAQLCSRGLEPRHLRQWRQSVDREIGLIEQLVLPLLRQRSESAHEQASELAHDVERLGEELRAALACRALRHLIGDR